MAFVLTSNSYLTGLEPQSILLLSALNEVATVSPFTVANVKTHLETSQPSTFSTLGFYDFINAIYSLELDYSSLNATEKTQLNIIREFLDPVPGLECCGSDAPTLLNVTQVYNDRVGSATFEKEARIELDASVTCNVYDIQLTINPQVGSPATSVPVNVLQLLGCVSSKSVYSFLWIDFASDPTGFGYDVEINLRDSTGASIVNLITTKTF